MSSGMLGKKVGMTQLFQDDGRQIPVTVLEMPENSILQVKTTQTDGYEALKLGAFDKKEKSCTRAELGASRAAKGPCCFVREIRLDAPAESEAGSVLRVGEVFEGVEKLKITGTSKGKGFQGVMKRWGFAGYRATHGVKTHHRHPGSIGQCQDPGRVFKGKKMAGQMGNKTVTQRGVRVVKIIPEKNLLLVRGAIPGANGSYVVVRADEGYKVPVAS
jgi:large subunit ribosomal protein L3